LAQTADSKWNKQRILLQASPKLQKQIRKASKESGADPEDEKEEGAEDAAAAP
jgi:hypothetical protein